MRKIVGLTMSAELHDEIKIMAVQRKMNMGELIESLLRKAMTYAKNTETTV